MALLKPPQPQGYLLFGPTPKLPDIPHSEWKPRITRLKKLMTEEKIDLLMLWSKNNCRYFTGYTSEHWNATSIQPLVALIPISDDPIVVAGNFFRTTVEAQCWVRDIRTQENEHDEQAMRSFPKEIAALVKEIGYEKGTIALEKGHLGGLFIPRPLNDIETLLSELPKARFVDGDKVIWGCRMIKSPLEIERLIKAAAIHRQALSTVVREYRPGMTEKDVGILFITEAYKAGAETKSSHIMCGSEKEGMLDTGHNFDGLTINKGDYLSMDICISSKGYWADMGRILNVGPPSEEFKKYSAEMQMAFDAGTSVAKPGVMAKEIWNATIKAGSEGSMVGHGIGLDVHEPPVLSATSEIILQPGMTLALEPAKLVNGPRILGGVGPFHYEDLLIITENGCNVIRGLPRHIITTDYP